MTLPANNTTISASLINTENGTVGNSTVTATNMKLSLNDFPVRYLTPGPGKTINTTASSLINMGDLSSSYLRERIGRLPSDSWFASAPDSYGNIYVLWGTSASALYAGKYSPGLNYFYWMKTITFNNANGSSATAIDGSFSSEVLVDSQDNVIFKFATFYIAKFRYERPYAIAFDSSGTLLWQSSSSSGAYTISIAGSPQVEGCVYNGTEFLMPGDGLAPVIRINNIVTTSGSLAANNTYGITNYTGGICSLVGSSKQTNAYVVGYGTNSTTYATVSQYSSSDTIAWTRRADTQSVFTSGCVDSSGNIWAVGHTGATAPTAAPVLIIKINSSGTLLFSRTIQYAGANTNNPKVYADPSDNIYIVSNMLANTTVNNNICISSLDSTGAARWHRSIRASTTATATYIGGCTQEVTGNRLLVPCGWSNTTVTQGITLHLNANTGSTVGTYGNNVLATLTPTFTAANAAGFTTLTTVTGTLTGLATSASANVNQAANSTPHTITFNNIT